MGLKESKRFILEIFNDHLLALDANAELKDAKSRLQEYLQANNLPLPIYNVESNHAGNNFLCSVDYKGEVFSASATIKKEAEQKTAALILSNLNQVMTKKFCGYISIVGKPNVGKSTLLNVILDKKVSITSRKSQTTRNNILGVKTEGDFQMVFLDTPGIHINATKTMNKVLNHSAISVIEDSDLVLFLVQRTALQEQDLQVINKIKESNVRAICVLNKVDQVENKNQLLPLIQTINDIYPFDHYIPISALNNEGIDELINLVKQSIPENEHLYPDANEDHDIPDNFFISELVREKIIRSLGDELPHETYVVVETKSMEGSMLSIGVVIYVARDSQKSIVIGHEGSNLKRIGQQARVELEKMFSKKVMLKTFVKVNKNWNNDAQYLNSLGVGSNHDAS